MNISPLDPASRVFYPAATKPAAVLVTVDTIYQLFAELQKRNIVDSTGFTQYPIEDISLPDASLIRIGNLLNQKFDFYTNSLHFPSYLGTLTPVTLLQNLWNHPIFLAGSAVWYVLGVEFIAEVLNKFSLKLSPDLEKIIESTFKFNDLDIKVKSKHSELPNLKNLIIQALLPHLHQKRANNESFAHSRALLKDHLESDWYLACVGDRKSKMVEVIGYTAPASLYYNDAPLISLHDYKVSSSSGSLLLSIFDFLAQKLRTKVPLSDNPTLDDTGWARTLCYFVRGYQTVDPQLNAYLTRNFVNRIPAQKNDEDVAEHILILLIKAGKNHLPEIINAHLKLALIASIELSKFLSKEQFQILWKKALEASVSDESPEAKTLNSIANYFANGTLQAISLYHWLKLIGDPLLSAHLDPLSSDKLLEYCEKPQLLSKACSCYSTHSLINVLFQHIQTLSSPIYWEKLKSHFPEQEQASLALLLPFKVVDTRSKVLINVEVTKPKVIKESNKSPLPPPQALVKPVEKKPIEPKTLFQMKGGEVEFQTTFDRACQECLESNNASLIKKHLEVGKNKFSFLASHDMFAKLILVALTLQNKVKENYKLSFSKVSSCDLRLELLYQFNLQQFPHDTVDFSKLLSELSPTSETDKKIRQLLKDRKGLNFNPLDIIQWLEKLQSAELVSEMKSWVDLLISTPKALLPSQGQPQENLKAFVLYLFSLPSIPSNSLHKLKKLCFKDHEKPELFYSFYQQRNDKNATSLAWEALCFVTDIELWQTAIPQWDETAIEKLLEESLEANLIPLPQEFVGDSSLLQNYCDKLFNVAVKKIVSDKYKYEIIAFQLLKFANKQANHLSSHDSFARLFLQTCDYKKKGAKETPHIDLAKISSPELILELVAHFDIQGLGYPTIDLSNLISEMPFSLQNDENLRKHIPHLVKAPCTTESLLLWIEKLLKHASIDGHKKWLPLMVGPLRTTLMGQEILKRYGMALIQDPEQNPEHIQSLRSMLPDTAKDQAIDYFNHFLVNPDEKALDCLFEISLELNNDTLFKTFFKHKATFALFKFLNQYDKLSQGTKHHFLSTLLLIPLSPAQKNTYYKPLLQLRESIVVLSTELNTLWIQWLLDAQLEIALIQVGVEFKEYKSVDLLHQWIRQLQKASPELRRQQSATVDSFFDWICLGYAERIEVFKSFQLIDRYLLFLEETFNHLPLETRADLLITSFMPHIEILDRIQPCVIDLKTKTYLGAQAYSRMMAKWVLNYSQAKAEQKFSAEDCYLVSVGIDDLTQSPSQLTSHKLENLKASTNLTIIALGEIDLEDAEIEEVCIKNISLLFKELLNSECPQNEIRVLSNNLLSQILNNCQRRGLKRENGWIPMLPFGAVEANCIEDLKTQEQKVRACQFINIMITELLQNPDVSRDLFYFVSNNCLPLLHSQIKHQDYVKEAFHTTVKRYLIFADKCMDEVSVGIHLVNCHSLLIYILDTEQKKLKASGKKSPYMNFYIDQMNLYIRLCEEFKKTFIEQLKSLAARNTPEACYEACQLLGIHYNYLFKDTVLLINSWTIVFTMFKHFPDAVVDGVSLYYVIYQSLITKFFNHADLLPSETRSAIILVTRAFACLLVKNPPKVLDNDHRIATYDLIYVLLTGGGFIDYESDLLQIVSYMIINPPYWLNISDKSFFRDSDPIFTLLTTFYQTVKKSIKPVFVDKLIYLAHQWISALTLLVIERNDKTIAHYNTLSLSWLKEPTNIRKEDAHIYLARIKIYLRSRDCFWKLDPEKEKEAHTLFNCF